MSNFALVNNTSKEVVNMVKADQDFIDFIVDDDTLTGTDFTWVEFTDTNRAIIGGTYNESMAKFIHPQPYHDWNLNTETLEWESPMDHPDGEVKYHWCEKDGEWVANENQA